MPPGVTSVAFVWFGLTRRVAGGSGVCAAGEEEVIKPIAAGVGVVGWTLVVVFLRLLGVVRGGGMCSVLSS